MNRAAMLRILNRAEPRGAVALADPPAPGICDLACHTSDHLERLWSLLDQWAGMDEVTWHPEAVDRLKDDILDVFKAHPEADAWFRDWREKHPAARLA